MKLPLLLLLPVFVAPWHTNAARLTVVVEGVKNNDGNVIINLFDQEGNWLKDAVRGEEKPAKEGPMEFVFDGLPEGNYGVWAHHDEDGDGKLKKGLLGRPEEPYGFSNDSGKMFGPADWKDAEVHLSKNAEVQILIHIK